MTEKRTVTSINDDLQALHIQLQLIAFDGRISMNLEPANIQYRDTGHALIVAFEALETAIDATRWMITDR